MALCVSSVQSTPQRLTQTQRNRDMSIWGNEQNRSFTLYAGIHSPLAGQNQSTHTGPLPWCCHGAARPTSLSGVPTSLMSHQPSAAKVPGMVQGQSCPAPRWVRALSGGGKRGTDARRVERKGEAMLLEERCKEKVVWGEAMMEYGCI